MVDIEYYKRINHEFFKRVGAINCVDRLHEMGLNPTSIIGTFWPRDVPKLIEVCARNPNLHIITNTKLGITVNRYVEGDGRYQLADGDSDPNLELRLPPEVINHIFSELNHLIRRMGIGF